MSAEQWDKDAEHGEDFWRQGDWDDLHDGQLIAAVWPSGARIGNLHDAGAGTLYLNLDNGGNAFSVESLRGDGAALFVEATPKLPTEPGAYKFAGWSSTAVLNESGQWYDDYGNKLHFSPGDSSRLTRLEPVPVTAKKVLERLANFWEFGPPAWMAAEIESIAAEFGVTL